MNRPVPLIGFHKRNWQEYVARLQSENAKIDFTQDVVNSPPRPVETPKIPPLLPEWEAINITKYNKLRTKRRYRKALIRQRKLEKKAAKAFSCPTTCNNQDNLKKIVDKSTTNNPIFVTGTTVSTKLADQPKVDIFSDDMDISNSKPGTSKDKPTVVGKIIPTTTGRGKNLDSINTKKKNLPKKMTNVPSETNQGQFTGTQKVLPAKKNMWQPMKLISAVGGPDNTRQQVKPPPVKFEMDKPNPKVEEGTASSIELNVNKSKGLVVDAKTDKATSTPKPIEEEKAAKPAAPAKSSLPSPGDSKTPSMQQQKPQTSGVQGRMTASSFMNVQQQSPVVQPQPNPQNYEKKYPSLAFNVAKGLAGIPKSFLTVRHQQQIQTQQHQQQAHHIKQHQQQLQIQQHQKQMMSFDQMYPNPQTDPNTFNQAPAWEASATQLQSTSWAAPSASRFDQLPNGQYIVSTEQTYGQSGQYSQSEPTDTISQQMFVQTDNNMELPKQQYSPSDAYADMNIIESNEEVLDESPDSQRSGSKRLSAFKRLGPVTQPKKPKLTINLLFNKEQSVREVVDQDDPDIDKYTPVHLRADIQTSLDDTVMKFFAFWPWKRVVPSRRTCTVRDSKIVMQMELEQMEELYEKDKSFFQVSVTGYPESWKKEEVLDAVLESVKGKSFIPCFIEFSKTECKFLVIRCKPALVAIHKNGFVYRQKDVELQISIMVVNITVNQIEFIPRLILRKRLSMAMEGETELDLKQFTLASDISHFIYFPLNRVSNQAELMNIQSSVPWEYLTKLVLSHNRISSLSGFDLPQFTPRLKHLDLSYNYLEGVTVLFKWRELPLNSICLEGNPLCADYIEHERYIKPLKMMFPMLKEIDGVKLALCGDIPSTKRNYSPPDAAQVASKVLEVLFPLLDAPPEERQLCEDLYDSNAVMTITFMYKLRYGPIYKDYRSLFFRARIMDEGEMDSIDGADAIAKLINRWPPLQHDPLSFNVDVIYHTDTTTIMRVSGIMKVTAETLAEDEHMLWFTRTLVLHSIDTMEYKITNEMIYWDIPDKVSARDAFKKTAIKSKNLTLKLDGPPDAELKEMLLRIFMKLTDLGRKPSERCLELTKWHLKNALEYFSKLLNHDDLESLVG